MQKDRVDDLIDYEEGEEAAETLVKVTSAAAVKKAAAASSAAAGNAQGTASSTIGKDGKKGHVGIHSTGFRDFLLKPELLRAIVDCGFEHPSEGMPCPQSISIHCLINT